MKKKTALSHYPRAFLNQIIFRTVSWTIFFLLFVKVGKECLDIDIVGKIYQFIFNKKGDFNQYFLGANKVEKSTLLSYAGYFIIAIIILNIVSLWLNEYLWKKDRYIENNSFYLHNKWIFFTNSLIHIACAFLLILSLVSPFTVILALLFISFNNWNWFPHQKKLKNPQTEGFFSWKNQYVRKITLYSFIVILFVPLVIGRLRSLLDNASSDAPTGLAKSFSDVLSTSPPLRKIIEILTGEYFSLDLLYWFILFWFAIKDLIGSRWKELGDFWAKINGIKKKVSNFKHYYYYQESWAIANNRNLINLGDYSYLKNSPNFLSKSYLESDLDVDKFAKENQKVIKHIEFCEEQVKEASKGNFLLYCLFNEFSSQEDCLRTRRTIRATRKQ